jgi:hypothetical protein
MCNPPWVRERFFKSKFREKRTDTKYGFESLPASSRVAGTDLFGFFAAGRNERAAAFGLQTENAVPYVVD